MELTLDTVSPSFTQVSKTWTQKLENQVPLQLGMIEICAAINYRAEVTIEIGDAQNSKRHFNTINTNRNDCTAGAPLVRQFRIRLDFRIDAIYPGGNWSAP